MLLYFGVGVIFISLKSMEFEITATSYHLQGLNSSLNYRSCCLDCLFLKTYLWEMFNLKLY